MRIALALSFAMAASPASGQAPPSTTPKPPGQTQPAQTQPAPPAQPAQPRPALPPPAAPAAPGQAQPAPTPAPRRVTPPPPSPAVTARTILAITVTDEGGTPLPGIRVALTGPTDRSGTTDTMGQLRVSGLQVGNYRLRFTGESVVTFEREVATRSGQTLDIDVTLGLAPPPPPPPPPPTPPPPPALVPAAVGPIGNLISLSLFDFIEKGGGLIRDNEPRKETLLSCSGNSRTTLVQLNQNQARRLYEAADLTYYVMGGEGTVRIDGRDTPIVTGAFVSIPRGTGHEVLRKGKRPLVLLTELSGEPCETAR